MSDRWATFDCYGTLIDWNRGIADALQRLWPEAEVATLLHHYHEIEPQVQAGAAVPYREVLGRCTRTIAAELDLPLAAGGEAALAESLPTWPPFSEVPAALRQLHNQGWRLAVLSNTDHDLLSTSVTMLGVPIDLTVTVADAGSYKPAPGHWQAFQKQTGVAAEHHIHVAASLYHDIVPCAELGIRAVWINRNGEISDLPRVAELPDLRQLPSTLDRLGERVDP